MGKPLLLGIASDHAGYELKGVIIKYLQALGHEVTDMGTNSSKSMDYPDVAHPLALSILNGKVEKGIAICGSGNGISITLNKHAGIRAALCWNSELAYLARVHNDANVLSLPSRFITENTAIECVKAFLETEFEGGRHLTRVEKINC